MKHERISYKMRTQEQQICSYVLCVSVVGATAAQCKEKKYTEKPGFDARKISQHCTRLHRPQHKQHTMWILEGEENGANEEKERNDDDDCCGWYWCWLGWWWFTMWIANNTILKPTYCIHRNTISDGGASSTISAYFPYSSASRGPLDNFIYNPHSYAHSRRN